MANGGKSVIFAFDGFKLDVEHLKLYRDGQEIVLAPKVVKILTLLVEEAGNIVSKEDLIRAAGDSNLAKPISVLRKALGTTYIETVRGRGYRFASDKLSIETPQSELPPSQEAERSSSVVGLTDLKDPEVLEPTGAMLDPVPGAVWKKHLMIVVGVGVLLILAVISLVYWFNGNDRAKVDDEISVAIETVPLTRGSYATDATISRDGMYIAFHEIDGEYSRLLLQQTGQANPNEVLPRAKRIFGPKTFSPDGQMIYYLAREGEAQRASLYRIPTAGGVAAKVVEDVASYVSFSPDGNSIAFVRVDPATGVYSVNIAASDGTGERILGSAEPGTVFSPNPAWSPDGKSIAFGNVGISGGKCTISAMDVETATIRPLSPEIWDACGRIEWRPDGKGVVFVGTKAADSNTTRRDQVYYLSTSDGVARRLTSDPSRKQTESLGVTANNEVLAVPITRSSQVWAVDPKGTAKSASRLTDGSSDGRNGIAPLKDGRVAFIARVGDLLGISMIDADGTNARQVFSPALQNLHATPDGKYFLFTSETEGGTQLFRVDADGSNLKQITEGEGSRAGSSISPDGGSIVFDSTQTPGGGKYIWRTSIEGGPPTKLSEQLCMAPHYSPSGKFISCTWSQQVFVLSTLDGKVVKTFTAAQIGMLNIGARWTPDERGLVYIVSEKGTTNLWIQPFDGKPARPLTDFIDGDIYNFAFAPDGSKLYLARGHQVRDAILIKNFR